LLLKILKNIVIGLLIIVPVVIIFLFIEHIINLLIKVGGNFGIESIVDGSLTVLVAAFLVGLVCYVVGWLALKGIGAWSFDRYETALLQKIPGYRIIRNISTGFLSETNAYPVAQIQLYGPGTWVFGFVMETNEDNLVTVFVPSSPALTMGNIHLVESDRIKILDTKPTDLMTCISEWGTGSNIVINKKS